MTSPALDAVRREQAARLLRTRGIVERLTLWVAFVAQVVAGVGLTVVGGLEWLDPTRLSVVLAHPEYYAGVGVGLLVSRRVIRLLASLEHAASPGAMS